MKQPEQEGSVEDQLIDRAVKIAQRAKSKYPLKIGDVVAHPSDEDTYEFWGIDGSIAHLGYTDRTTGKIVSKDFPFEEIFDATLARDIAVKLTNKAVAGVLRSRLN